MTYLKCIPLCRVRIESSKSKNGKKYLKPSTVMTIKTYNPSFEAAFV